MKKVLYFQKKMFYFAVFLRKIGVRPLSVGTLIECSVNKVRSQRAIFLRFFLIVERGAQGISIRPRLKALGYGRKRFRK